MAKLTPFLCLSLLHKAPRNNESILVQSESLPWSRDSLQVGEGVTLKQRGSIRTIWVNSAINQVQAMCRKEKHTSSINCWIMHCLECRAFSWYGRFLYPFKITCLLVYQHKQVVFNRPYYKCRHKCHFSWEILAWCQAEKITWYAAEMTQHLFAKL